MSDFSSLVCRYIHAFSTNPKKVLKNVPKLLQNFNGREQKLLWLMAQKYGHGNLQFVSGLGDRKFCDFTWSIRLIQLEKWLDEVEKKKVCLVCVCMCVLCVHLSATHTHTEKVSVHFFRRKRNDRQRNTPSSRFRNTSAHYEQYFARAFRLCRPD